MQDCKHCREEVVSWVCPLCQVVISDQCKADHSEVVHGRTPKVTGPPGPAHSTKSIVSRKVFIQI